MFKRAKRENISRARALQRTATEAERLLWWKLKPLNKLGYHFRRQAPFRSYTLDFVEHKSRLVIELDGGQHGAHDHHSRDRKRDTLLASQGYRTLRFWNNEVFENLDAVVETIFSVLEKRNHPPPPARARSI
ncbi:MAG: endonuclease domain-containing protein [Alphaproteobacteria bacterium]